MSNYRPITDMWILARAKLKDGQTYYGAYLGGFPERARVLIGCSLQDPCLHVCSGKAKDYPYDRGFGPDDFTMDIDVALAPDIVGDAEKSIPTPESLKIRRRWGGILIDPPYTPEDAKKYATGMYPNPHKLTQNAIDAVEIGKKIGIIHYVVPKCPKNAKFVAVVGVICGFANRIRVFSVFEKIPTP